MATLYISTAILAEATLSFLGLGPPPPTPTWGSMINDGELGAGNGSVGGPFLGLAITLTVLGFSLVGDGVRDALDARLRDRSLQTPSAYQRQVAWRPSTQPLTPSPQGEGESVS